MGECTRVCCSPGSGHDHDTNLLLDNVCSGTGSGSAESNKRDALVWFKETSKCFISTDCEGCASQVILDIHESKWLECRIFLSTFILASKIIRQQCWASYVKIIIYSTLLITEFKKCNIWGRTVAQRLALVPHSKKVQRGLSVWRFSGWMWVWLRDNRIWSGVFRCTVPTKWTNK